MNFQNVKGTRDLYPQDMRKLNRILDTWRRVSLRNGFEEFDAPTFEYLDLFTAKSGPEIAEQLFNFTDRGGRQLAIRAEMTPSLARMVNAKVNSLPRPIKWFCMPRVCRGEAPQQGRLREFYQWNIDVIGEDSELADAECVYVAVDALRELGLGQEDIVVRYSSRALLSEVLASLGIAAESAGAVMGVLDKRDKVPAEVFNKMLADAVADEAARTGIVAFLSAGSDGQELAPALAQAGLTVTEPMAAAMERLESFRRALKFMGVDGYCRYDTGIVRGLAYYTGIVYEIFDTKRELRAVAGGGRYDNLLQALGGPKIGACGFGMGDVVLGILLDKKGLAADAAAGALDYFVIDAEEGTFNVAMQVVAALRQSGLASDFSYRRSAVGKQLQQANRRGARAAVIVRNGSVAVKDLLSGTQSEMTLEQFLAQAARRP